VIATILLLGITLVLVVVLYEEIVVPLPRPAPYVGYEYSYSTSEPAWGDGSDCTGGMNPTCQTLPALIFTVTGVGSPAPNYNNTKLIFECGGTVYLEGTLWQLDLNPASGAMPGPGAPQLQRCGSFIPPMAAFNRMLFFDPLTTTARSQVQAGDQIVVFVHTSLSWLTTDDDYHGTPTSCYQNYDSCSITILYTGSPAETLATIPINPPAD
jgi:hypothetical protein